MTSIPSGSSKSFSSQCYNIPARCSRDTSIDQQRVHYLRVDLRPLPMDALNQQYKQLYASFCEMQEQWQTEAPAATTQIIRDTVRKIHFVSIQSFCCALRGCLADYDADRQYDRPDEAAQNQNRIILIEGQKSNKWIAELAIASGQLSIPNTDQLFRLGVNDAEDFVATISSDPSVFRGKEIVLFDDASYSGTQITNHVSAIITVNQSFALRLQQITVIIPFVTRTAIESLARLSNIANSGRRPILGGVKLYYREIMPTLREQGWNQADAQEHNLNPRTWTTLATTFFQLKVPNEQSFPHALCKLPATPSGQRTSILPVIIPPYKHETHIEASSDSSLVPNIHLTFLPRAVSGR